jgi:hypothetical protein
MCLLPSLDRAEATTFSSRNKQSHWLHKSRWSSQVALLPTLTQLWHSECDAERGWKRLNSAERCGMSSNQLLGSRSLRMDCYELNMTEPFSIFKNSTCLRNRILCVLPGQLQNWCFGCSCQTPDTSIMTNKCLCYSLLMAYGKRSRSWILLNRECSEQYFIVFRSRLQSNLQKQRDSNIHCIRQSPS